MNEVVFTEWHILGQVYSDLQHTSYAIWETYESQAEWEPDDVPCITAFHESEFLEEAFYNPIISFLAFGNENYYNSRSLNEEEIDHFWDCYSDYGAKIDKDVNLFLLRHQYFFTHTNDYFNNPFVLVW